MVPGKGPQPALGMIVGEAPGRVEVERGEPFVGPSGRLLDIGLHAVGVDRLNVYLTNVVKEWPRGSDGFTRRPYQPEIDYWYPLLESEIQHTAPRAILALGTTAARSLTGTMGAGGAVLWGEVWDYGKVVVPAWHPSYLLHGGPQDVEQEEVQERWLAQLRTWADLIQGEG